MFYLIRDTVSGNYFTGGSNVKTLVADPEKARLYKSSNVAHKNLSYAWDCMEGDLWSAHCEANNLGICTRGQEVENLPHNWDFEVVTKRLV